MATNSIYGPTCRTYGVPIYGAGWVPPVVFKLVEDSSDAVQKTDSDGDADISTNASLLNFVVLAGGGGEGHSGVPNAILISKFDFDSNSLSDEPLTMLGTGQDLPYRIAVHPGGEGLICSFLQSCRWYEWDIARNNNGYSLSLRSSERVLQILEDIGQQLSLAFNTDGSSLAVGGEDGKLRVLKWPSMELIFDEANAHDSVKDLHFSPDGKFLVSVRSGAARVWDVLTFTAIALQKENDEVFGFCKFSGAGDMLHITLMKGRHASIVTWNTVTWQRTNLGRVFKESISAFNASFDGKFLAIGTIEGNIKIVRNSNMQIVFEKKAHLGIVTALAFSQHSSSVLSASMDSSVRVTLIETQHPGFSLRSYSWIIVSIILAFLLYYVQSNGSFLKDLI